MKNILYILIFTSTLFISGCNSSKEDPETEISFLNNQISQQDNEIIELRNIIIAQKNEIDDLNRSIAVLEEKIEAFIFTGKKITEENDNFTFTIPETYEEAQEIMDRLGIKNVVLERIEINNEVFTVVEVVETVLTVAGDGLVEAYDIPDSSGNVIFLAANPPPKLLIYAASIAIVEEPYITSNGNLDHWVKIRMEDGRIGWIKGEHTGLDRGGIKYLTQRNIWLENNYARYYR